MSAYALINDDWTPFLENISGLTGDPSLLFQGVGEAVKDCTVENFGATGTNRPTPWPLLSKKYAKKVKREFATLEVTGDLKASVTVSPPTSDSIEVVAYDEKASWHQDGERYNKTRQFFPISQNGELTDYCQNRITETLDKLFAVK